MDWDGGWEKRKEEKTKKTVRFKVEMDVSFEFCGFLIKIFDAYVFIIEKYYALCITSVVKPGLHEP